MTAAALSTFLLLGLGSCGGADRVRDDDGSRASAPGDEPVPAQGLPAEQLTVPVQVGEAGFNFPACSARGSFRRVVDEDGLVEVRAAPFEASRATAELPAGASFFICARSHDQRWLGIVFDVAGAASAECRLAAPVPSRRDYEGPCRSGWVSSAVVTFVPGSPRAPVAEGAAAE